MRVQQKRININRVINDSLGCHGVCCISWDDKGERWGRDTVKKDPAF